MTKKKQKYVTSTAEYFLLPSEQSTARLEVKKSVFFADLTKAKNKTEAKAFIARIKKNRNGARHHCWAYIIGNPMNPAFCASNDDGEPRGSASKSIISVLTQNSVGYVAVIVTRYFGGIKLGLGGLKRAYSKSTTTALNNVKLKSFHKQRVTKFLVPYNLEGVFLYVTNEIGASVLSVQYGSSVIFEISVDESIFGRFLKIIRNKTRNKVILEAIPNY